MRSCSRPTRAPEGLVYSSERRCRPGLVTTCPAEFRFSSGIIVAFLSLKLNFQPAKAWPASWKAVANPCRSETLGFLPDDILRLIWEILGIAFGNLNGFSIIIQTRHLAGLLFFLKFSRYRRYRKYVDER